jgi:effector-binding domain-containing protein
VAQLVRLHRLLALRDLGFTLEQIAGLLDRDVPSEQLRGMLRLRRAQLEQSVADEQARLRRVEAHLRAIEGSNAVKSQDIVIKQTQPLRVAEARGIASGLDHEHIGPLFMQLAPKLISHLQRAAADPGTLVGYYDAPEEDGRVTVHVAYEVGERSVPASDGVEVVELPVVEVASVVHRGDMENIGLVYEGLIRWIEDSGYQLAGYSRELYHEMASDGPSVTELQIPIARWTR